MRDIPIQMQPDFASGLTSNTFLLKITPPNQTGFGVTALDIDFTYDDGDGAITYQSTIGLDQSNIENSENLEVNNSEATALLIPQTQFNEQDIQNGLLDYGEWALYMVDWKAPENGHVVIDSGTVGEVTLHDDLGGVIELRGLTQGLRQTFTTIHSLLCPATFGSMTKKGTALPCMFDASTLWESGTITAVDATEPDRIFTTDLPTPTGPNGDLTYTPGLLEMFDGDNAGKIAEIESFEAGVVTLRFALPAPAQVGETLQARPDCAKRYVQDCKDKYSNEQWHRGQYLIPLTDEDADATPGATYPGFGQGVVPGTLQ